MAVEIHGFCEPAFQPLKDAFAANFADGLEVGASLAVTRHGKPVVDLWAGHANFSRTRPWEKDTIVVVFSLTKVPLLLAFLMLVDRGLVDLDAPVATYWPEFGAGGKAHVTVREAMTHRAGVPGFVPAIPFEALLDWNTICAQIAVQQHWFGGESICFYHGLTIGFILGEIMRRVDGRLPSQFFREEIAEPAGIDVQLGLRSRADRDRLAHVGYLTAPAEMPYGSRMATKAHTSVGEGDWRQWETQIAEIPSANGYANGRSIARLCALGSNGGVLDGVRYLSQAIVDEASAVQVDAVDGYWGPITLGLGFGLHRPEYPAPTPTCFHWGGYGGSFGVMDQATGIGCGYAMNNLITPEDQMSEPRYWRLWGTLGEVMARL